MGCRCTDIRNCILDIATIVRMQRTLSNMEEHISVRIMGTSNSVSDALGDLAKPNNLAADQEAIERENKPLATQIGDLVLQCQEEIPRLHNKLKSMNREDDAYHENL